MKIINHQFHINSSKDSTLGYDLIIGRDLMKKPGMIVELNNKELIWENAIVPMLISGANFPKPTLSRAKIKQSIQWTADTKVTREETEIIVKILYSKYKKANLHTN